MSHSPVLTRTRIHAGHWEGVLACPGDTAPELAVTHQDRPLDPPEITALPDEPGRWRVRVAIPAHLLADGVQTFLISEKAGGGTLASFAIITGEALEDDIRAEMDLLRAELDMLKRAFRRHCVETA